VSKSIRPVSTTKILFLYCTVIVTVVEVVIVAWAESVPVTVKVYLPAVVAGVLGVGTAF